MKICVFGAGCVGLATGACLSEMGKSVVCVDVDALRVADLCRNVMPIHEPGLRELVVRNTAAGRLQFTTDAAAAVSHGTIVFIAVGTPAAEYGSADLDHVLAVASTIGCHMNDFKVRSRPMKTRVRPLMPNRATPSGSTHLLSVRPTTGSPWQGRRGQRGPGCACRRKGTWRHLEGVKALPA